MYTYMITCRRTLCSQLHVFSSWLLQDASTLWTMVDDAASSLSAISSSTCASLADKDGWDVELPQNCWTCGRYWKWAAGDWRAVCQFCRDQQSCAMYLAWVRVASRYTILQQWRAIQRLMVPRPVGFVLAPAHQPDRQLEKKGPLEVNDS